MERFRDPLEDSPKCPGCSLVAICLPDETWSLRRSSNEPEQMMLFEERAALRKGPASRSAASDDARGTN